ncbi:MAG: hypothetical protein LBI60_05790 [Bacteroidales bacterium]|jgi:hypothetical protein|nr:hypothetical protein [Bacteroidales bacterium]
MNKKVSITDRVKSYEDACKELGKEPIVDFGNDTIDEVAYKKLKTIIKALNEGWEPDWMDYNQLKYFNWFYIAHSGASAGFGFASTYYTASHSYTLIGSRLCFKDEKTTIYACGQFRDLYFEYLFIEMPKNYGK